jgi:glycosyltransferase involved in cell wall biosynthesis
MMEEYKISIVLPVYNGQKYLAKSIESCLSQTYKNIELIIVNDCSTDDTQKIIDFFASKDNRIKVIKNLQNKKLPGSLNIGHKVADGDLITWTSDDNIYNLDALEILSHVLVDKKLDVVYSNIILIDENGKDLREVNLPGIENIIFGNNIGSSFLYRRSVYEKNKEYNENLFLVEDYDFWLRAISHSKFGKVNMALYRYRKHSETLTNQIDTNHLKNALWKTNVFKMYDDFCANILGQADSELATFFYKKLTHEQLDFEWLKINQQKIDFLRKQLLKNLNFSDAKTLETLFLKKHIEILVDDQRIKKYLKASFYILKKYFQVIDKNSLKTLVKFSFLK